MRTGNPVGGRYSYSPAIVYKAFREPIYVKLCPRDLLYREAALALKNGETVRKNEVLFGIDFGYMFGSFLIFIFICLPTRLCR
jgi:hypothetical protein